MLRNTIINSKFAAFNDRGIKDPRTSHDFEDIIYVMDNRTDIVEQLIGSPFDVKTYLTERVRNVLHNRVMKQAIYGNLFYEIRKERY